MLFQRREINKQSTCGEKQNITTNNTQLMQMSGKCVRISISHICVRRDCGAQRCALLSLAFICGSYLQTSVYSPSAAALIPCAPPKRPQYLLFAWVRGAVSAPDVGGKRRRRCRGRGVNNASGSEVKRREKVQQAGS